jgi:hypothetical protein
LAVVIAEKIGVTKSGVDAKVTLYWVAPTIGLQNNVICRGEEASIVAAFAGEIGIGVDGISTANATPTRDKTKARTTRILTNSFFIYSSQSVR